MKRTKSVKILILLNCMVIFSCSWIDSSASSLIIPDNTFTDCNTTLLWNYTMGDGGRGLSITPDGTYLAVGSFDRNVYLFDTNDPTPLWNKTLSGIIGDVVISANGEYITATTDDDKLYLFHRSSSTPIWNFTAGNLIRSMALTPDGRYIVAGSDDFSMYLFNNSSPVPIWNYNLGNQVKAVAITSDGAIIAGGGVGIGVHVFNSSLMTAPIWVNASMTSVYSVDISENDQYLVAGTLTGATGTIFLYEILDSQPLQEYEASATFGHVSITSEGDYFVGSVSFENSFYLFETGVSSPIWNFTANNQIEETDISGDGNFIACGSYDYNFYLFNRPNIYASLEMKEMIITKSFTTEGFVFSVELSEDGQYIAVLSNDDKVYMFHNEIQGESETPPSISFGPFFLIVIFGTISLILLINKIKFKSGKPKIK